MKVTQLTKLEPEVVKRYWEIYQGAFAPMAELSPCRQSLSEDEFVEEMEDESVIKFVLWGDGEDSQVVTALCFIATDLAKVAWISPAYYAKHFPEQAARGAIYYFQALLVNPEYQGGRWVKDLLKELVLFTGRNRAVAAFDCCQFNVNAGFPDLIAVIADQFSVVETLDLKEPQHYYAYVTHGVKDA